MTKDFNTKAETAKSLAAFKAALGDGWTYAEKTEHRTFFLKFTDAGTGEPIGEVRLYQGEKNAKPGGWRREPGIFFIVSGRHVTGGRPRGWSYGDPSRETSKPEVAAKHVENYFRLDNNEELYQEARRAETTPMRRAMQVASKKLRMLADTNARPLAVLAAFGESGVLAQAVGGRWMVLKDLDADDHYPDMTPGDVSTFRLQYRKVSEVYEEAMQTLAEVEEAVDARFGIV